MQGVAEASPLVMAWNHIDHPPNSSGLMMFMYRTAKIGVATMVEPDWINMVSELRFLSIGYKPDHIGGPPMIIAGRGIEASHFEVVADIKTGLKIGEIIRMRGFDYTVVGLTKNMVGSNADPVIYASLANAQNIIFNPDPELLRNIRRRTGMQLGGAAAVAPRLAAPMAQNASTLSENIHMINAIVVKVEPGASIEEVAEEIRHWKHLEVYTSARQVNLQLMGSNRLILMQLSLFRLLLLIIAGVIIGLITYTFTLDKIKDIAVLKLLGTQTSRIYSMIIQQAVLMGLLGTVLGALLEFASEPYFSRRVSATRVAIARALANRPAMILADESTASLDTDRGLSVMRMLRKVSSEQGTAILVVTHDERMIGEVDRVLQLVDGLVTSDESQSKDKSAASKVDPKPAEQSGLEPSGKNVLPEIEAMFRQQGSS